ncbi:MAG: hypothetical protein GX127_02725 [Eubacteriaceae bacterium]|jgi:trimethylamine--corrinoid protein Co-methyltransferase|nr:hypothetical protein [Eubacteriaceae bacterium]
MKKKFLDSSTISNLRSKVSETLQKVGIRFEHESALDLFKKHGIRVEGDRVYLTDKEIEDALSTFPSYEIGEITERKLINQLFFGVPYILDEETEKYRRAAISDVVKMYQLGETSDLYEGAGICVVDPHDNDAEDKYVAQIAMLLKYSDKFFTNGFRANSMNSKNKDIYQSAYDAIKLVREIRGAGEDEVIMNQCICPMSPLSYDNECILNINAAVVQGQSITLVPCTLANLTGPANILGLNIHDMALALAGTVYIQLLRPGTEIYYSVCSTAADMRTLQPSYGSVEEVFVSVGFYELCLSYKLSCSICATLADSAKPDFQAGVESTITTLLPFELTEIDCVYCYPGLMSGFYCGSFEKAIYDEELIRISNHYLKGINQNIDPNVIDDMLNSIDSNTFLSGRTPKRYREDFYLPKIFSKYGVSEDTKPEKKEIHLLALAEIERRINKYQLPERTKEQKELLNRYLPEACKY